MRDDLRDRLYAAIEQYNRGDYLGCQEPMEEVWRDSEEADRPLVRALIMLACGMHLHFQRGGGRGALNLFRQSLLLLDDLRPERAGIATGELYDALEVYLGDLESRRKPGAGFFDRWLAPRIRLPVIGVRPEKQRTR